MEDNELIKIPLTQGKFAIVDKEDYSKIMNYKWFAVKSRNNFYAATHGEKRETIKMHRLILGLSEKNKICDHIDHNGLNNSKSNLRVCDNSQNIKNTTSRIGSTSSYLGVSFRPVRKRKLKDGGYSVVNVKNKWVSQIQCNKKKYFIGRFETEKEAAVAYNNEALKKFGEFANLNKIC
jgi:hypothetical protein